MRQSIRNIVLVIALILLFGGAVVVMAQGIPSPPSTCQATPPDTTRAYLAAGPPLTPTQFITVTSTGDGGGLSERCETDSPCTLRRAINQVRYHQSDDETYQISFNIPITDTGYDSDNGVWLIEVDSDRSGSETYAFREFGSYGHVIVDGTTQPDYDGLRPDSPRIVLRGDNRKGALNLTGGYNVVRGLAFQGFGDNMIYVADDTDYCLIEDNWFGLTITGTEIYLRNSAAPSDGSGEAGVFVHGGFSHTVQNNLLVGFKASAIDLQSDASFVLSNTVGTRADGTVPEVRPERYCQPNARYYNWFPGAGIDVGAHDNLIAYNRIVGMLWLSNDPLNTPDDALEVSGHDHVVRDNVIGIDSAGQRFGVCGDGIHVGGAYGAHFIQVTDNTIVGAQGTAGILVTAGELGYDLDAVTVQNNVIEESDFEAFKFGDKVPTVLRAFKPAAITTIDGADVSGSSGPNSPCAGCTIELFLDRYDTITATLESWGTVTADGAGNWSATLPRPLLITEGLRTASTTAVDGQIENESGTISYSAGTTTRISEIYTQTGAPAPTPPPDPTPAPPISMPPVEYLPPPSEPVSYTTLITVTTTADPDDGEQYVCYRADHPGLAGKTNRLPCTLRQAIEEADSLAAVASDTLPILIHFDIPTSDPGYEDSGGYWVIQLTETLKLNALPYVGAQTTIDGATQPDHDGLRPDAPRIVLRGPLENPVEGYAMVFSKDGGVIRGLAFQKFRMALQFNGSGNIVQDNWLGLSADGQDLYWRDDLLPEQGTGLGGIKVADNTSGHLIQDNRLAGFIGAAIDVEGDDAYIVGNYVGLNADGVIPVTIPPSRYCRPNARYYNWYGGAGVEVSGRRNRVGGPDPADRNVIAGLLWYSADPENTPDTALDVYGQDHLIQGNYIGLDANGQEVGTCGRGIAVDAWYSRILSNTIYGTGLEALRSSGTYATTNARYFQGNTVKDSEYHLRFGNFVPEALTTFTPTQVITIDGTTVSGGDGHPKAPCPYCQVELFLDNLDEVTDTLEALVTTTTDGDGNWSVELARSLALSEGIRTASTPLNYGTIENHDAGTTSRFSIVYSQTGAVLPPPPPEPTPEPPLPIPEVAYADPPEPPATYNTTITVDTTDDASTSQTCEGAAAGECSLRRAINQVADLSDAERPALIQFSIPTGVTGHDDTLDTWKITLTAELPEVEGGQVTIDGGSQPGGRPDAPPIILLRDSSTGADLQLGVTQFEGEYVVQGLALQGVEVSMTGERNIIQDNWLGLSDDGLSIYFYNEDSSSDNHAIINGASAGDNNLVQNNVLAGSRTKAIEFQSDDNLIQGNYIGSLADGTIDVASVNPDNICDQTATTENWFGGGGIYVSVGRRNRILDNVLVGLLIRGSATTTPPDAIELPGGQDNLVQNNRIGQDAAGTDRWICGSGLDVGAGYSQILSNTVVSSFQAGLFVNGTASAINADTLRGNVISNCVQAIEFGDAVPDDLALFGPALVTVIDGTDVSGISDDPCPYCWVDVYLDDDDGFPDARAYLGATIADVNGEWSFSLPAPLAEGQGLRTISTARDYGIIDSLEAGTSSGLSSLFTEQPPTAPSGVSITGPSQPLELGVAHTFVASVSPVTATLPITYTWQATGQAEQVIRGGAQSNVSYSWDTPGSKTITVTVRNAYGNASHSQSFSVGGGGGYEIYLPIVMRNN